MQSHRAHRRATVLAAVFAGAGVMLPATTAFAHVTVNPREATEGSYAKLAFRAPNERDETDTTRLEIAFPEGHPFSSVSIRPKEGWEYTVEEKKLATPVKTERGEITDAVVRVTWLNGAIKPGEFEEFEVSVGPLPENVDSLTFKAIQTYSDGEIVRWIEEPKPDGTEPERPAPVLELTKAAATTPTTTPDQAAAQDGAVNGNLEVATKRDVDNARVFGIIGMVFGLLGFVSAMAARRRRDAPVRPESGGS